MRFFPHYTDDSKALDFAKAQPYVILFTLDEGNPRSGIYNHVWDGQGFVLHLHFHDEQVLALKKMKEALILAHDFLSVIPSHWVDEKYGGAATAYYLFAEFKCHIEWLESDEEKKQGLQLMLDHFQPEKGYDPLDPESDVYKAAFKVLRLVRLVPFETKSKWKLGQNRPPEIRRRVVEELKKRGRLNDQRAAEAVLSDLDRSKG